jgi:hypothetical protein
MLEARLVELERIPDLVHVIVEADATHGDGSPKPYRYPDQASRFARWADRIRYIQATGLPDTPDPWDREHAQREWCAEGVTDAQPDDIILHGDVDEIPTDLAARYVQPRGIVVFQQRMHPFAVDWFHPDPWQGTTACRYRDLTTFSALRDARFTAAPLPDAGWHFSWVGDPGARVRKINSFCHPEIRGTWEPHLEDCWASGLHVDGTPLRAVTVDHTWPRWVVEGRAPDSWYRPPVPAARPNVTPASIYGPGMR